MGKEQNTRILLLQYFLLATTYKAVCNNDIYVHQICLHTGPEVNPNHRDADTLASTAEDVSSFIHEYFKGVSTTPSISELCMYTVSKIFIKDS